MDAVGEQAGQMGDEGGAIHNRHIGECCGRLADGGRKLSQCATLPDLVASGSP